MTEPNEFIRATERLRDKFRTVEAHMIKVAAQKRADAKTPSLATGVGRSALRAFRFVVPAGRKAPTQRGVPPEEVAHAKRVELNKAAESVAQLMAQPLPPQPSLRQVHKLLETAEHAVQTGVMPAQVPPSSLVESELDPPVVEDSVEEPWSPSGAHRSTGDPDWTFSHKSERSSVPYTKGQLKAAEKYTVALKQLVGETHVGLDDKAFENHLDNETARLLRWADLFADNPKQLSASAARAKEGSAERSEIWAYLSEANAMAIAMLEAVPQEPSTARTTETSGIGI